MAAHAKGYQGSEEFIANDIRTGSFFLCGLTLSLCFIELEVEGSIKLGIRESPAYIFFG
jgi:hypothetical protein